MFAEAPAQSRRRKSRGIDALDRNAGLHAAAFGTALLIAVAIGRLPEIAPFLEPLALGKVAAALAIMGLLAGRRQEIAVFANPIGKLIAAMLALATLSVTFSIWNIQSLKFLTTAFLVDLLIFYLVAKTAATLATYRFYIATFVGSVALIGLKVMTLDTETRATVTTAYDPNDLALVMLTALPFVAVRVFACRGARRFSALALTGLFVAGTLATGSRGGFLGLAVVGAYLVFTQLPAQKRKAGLTAKMAVLALIGALAIGLTAQTTWDRISTITDLKQDYNVQAESGRLAIWGRGLEIMAERPWGVGLAAFEAAEGGQGGRYKAAHNALIQIGAELGVVALLIYLGYYRSALRQLPRAEQVLPAPTVLTPERKQLLLSAIALRAALIGFFVTSFFLSQAYSPLLYLLLGLTVATAYRQRALETSTAIPPNGKTDA